MADTQIESTGQATLLATFFVGDALCALDAAGVQEVIRVESVTEVRHAPPEVVGVMNLRGKIVTLLDPGVILGLGKSVLTKESRVFIIEDRNEFLGILVDRAGEVMEGEPGRRGGGGGGREGGGGGEGIVSPYKYSRGAVPLLSTGMPGGRACHRR